jgi:hypothetical protein
MFELKINLGNEAMQCPSDVAEALRKLAKKLDGVDDFALTDGGKVMDSNGNSVGEWSVEID